MLAPAPPPLRDRQSGTGAFPAFDALQLFSSRPHIWVFTRPRTACPTAGEIRPGAVPDVEYGFVSLHSFQRGLLAGFVIAASFMLV